MRDIAKRLGVKMSSVSSALKILGTRELIRYDPHQFITLTEKGILNQGNCPEARNTQAFSRQCFTD